MKGIKWGKYNPAKLLPRYEKHLEGNVIKKIEFINDTKIKLKIWDPVLETELMRRYAFDKDMMCALPTDKFNSKYNPDDFILLESSNVRNCFITTCKGDFTAKNVHKGIEGANYLDKNYIKMSERDEEELITDRAIQDKNEDANNLTEIFQASRNILQNKKVTLLNENDLDIESLSECSMMHKVNLDEQKCNNLEIWKIVKNKESSNESFNKKDIPIKEEPELLEIVKGQMSILQKDPHTNLNNTISFNKNNNYIASINHCGGMVNLINSISGENIKTFYIDPKVLEGKAKVVYIGNKSNFIAVVDKFFEIAIQNVSLEKSTWNTFKILPRTPNDDGIEIQDIDLCFSCSKLAVLE